MSTTDIEVLIDLDAARREAGKPEGIPVRFGGEVFVLPAELPVDVFDPIISDEFDLVGLLKPVLADESDDGFADTFLKVLESRPGIVREVKAVIEQSFALLFGADDYARFVAHRPGLGDYVRLGTGLFKLYGTTVGEAFASPASSEAGGATQKPTSPGSTPGSTPALSGELLAPDPGSSESAV